MDAHSQEQVESTADESQQAGTQKGSGSRSVRPCNFRSAGRLSNEHARALSAINETFARHLTGALDAYLGSGVKVKMQPLEQFSIKEYIDGIPAFSYLAPYSFAAISSTMIVDFDVNLVFPIIDMLLGGQGSQGNDARELSEIEEEIMQDMTSLIARQAEQTWGVPSLSLKATRRIKPSGLQQLCQTNERITIAKFEIQIAGMAGSFQLLLPPSFINFLIKQADADQPRKQSKLRYFPATGIRERILDCDFVVAADLPGMRVSVRDLIALQPGCVLKLRAPVRAPGMLTVEGQEIFEAAPVRNGAQKAAQLGRKVPMTSWGRE